MEVYNLYRTDQEVLEVLKEEVQKKLDDMGSLAYSPGCWTRCVLRIRGNTSRQNLGYSPLIRTQV